MTVTLHEAVAEDQTAQSAVSILPRQIAGRVSVPRDTEFLPEESKIMKNADFHSPVGRLADAMKHLEHTWMETKEVWSDSVSQKVEDDYLVPLHGQVQALVDTVGKLAGVMASAERACQHPRESGPVL